MVLPHRLVLREKTLQSIGVPVVTGTRIPPVVEGQDGGGDEMNEEYLRTDKWSSMLDMYII